MVVLYIPQGVPESSWWTFSCLRVKIRVIHQHELPMQDFFSHAFSYLVPRLLWQRRLLREPFTRQKHSTGTCSRKAILSKHPAAATDSGETGKALNEEIFSPFGRTLCFFVPCWPMSSLVSISIAKGFRLVPQSELTNRVVLEKGGTGNCFSLFCFWPVVELVFVRFQ